MLVSAENVSIYETDILITAANLEKMLLADDLFTLMQLRWVLGNTSIRSARASVSAAIKEVLAR